jgi:fructokinase
LKAIDILCIGEVLIDFIGHEINTPIKKTKDFHRFLGGSPTNVAVNAARLGLKSTLVASCGNDGLGDYILKKLNEAKVDTAYIARMESIPTSVIFVSKSTTTPDFIPYRQADCQIFESFLPDEVISQSKIFHTTCFALSKNPARQTIINRAKKAKELGLQLSIDINFSERIWPDKAEAIQVLSDYLANDPLVKLSEDDCFRLFGETKSEDYIFQFFHALGATTICLTKGKNGVVVSDTLKGSFVQSALPISEIKDATGAGDAFWTGFLYAQLQQLSLDDCMTIAQKLAAIKLQSLGKLPDAANIIELIQK